MTKKKSITGRLHAYRSIGELRAPYRGQGSTGSNRRDEFVNYLPKIIRSANSQNMPPDCKRSLAFSFIKSAKRRWFSFCMADSTEKELRYGKALVGGLLLAKSIQRRCPDEIMVGVILPVSVAGALANIALLFA